MKVNKSVAILYSCMVCVMVVFLSFTLARMKPDVDELPNQSSPEAQVIIDHMSYSPDTLTISKGTKVIWTDKQGVMPHTVTSDKSGLFDSGNMHKNDTFSYVFNDVGNFSYKCTHHKKMHGVVIVK